MMPTSTTSLDPVKSTRSKFRTYRITTRTSAVDESLFGSPARFKQMTGNRSWGNSSAPSTVGSEGTRKEKQKFQSSNPEIVQVITKDLIRKIKVPSTPDPSGESVILDKYTFDRIKQRSKVLAAEDKQLKEQTLKAEKNQKLDSVNTRKKEMEQHEISRKKNEKPSDLEMDERVKGSELLSKAQAMREEQDDEIKKVNEFILNAKCHAIRDAQLKEKEEILCAVQDEEARLDMMMEIERLKSIQESEERDQDMALQRFRGADMIRKQIEEREELRLLDAERKDQEIKNMLCYLERLQQEDMDNIQKKREAQKKLMEGVTKSNEEIYQQKRSQREQLKLEDMRVLEYIKDKQRREEEHQKELERQKAEKEKEIAHLRTQQERANDKQAERDALKAKRRQEDFERDWRRKEKEETEKKSVTERMLIEARQEQIRNKEHFLAVQAQRDRTEFERVLGVQQELMDADKKKQLDDAKRRHSHAEEVRKQVRKREEEKIAARRNFFEEGVKLDQEAKDRRKKLDEIKQRKLSELKAAGVSEKYCAEVSRRITAPPPSFTMST